MSFAKVKKVTITIHDGKRQRDWVVGAIKRHCGKQLDAAPLVEDRIIISAKKKEDKLFFTQEPNPNWMGMVPIFKVEEWGKTFGVMGVYPKTGRQLMVSVNKVVNAK